MHPIFNQKLALFLALQATVVLLLNQRQWLAFWFFVPVVVLGFLLFIPSSFRDKASFTSISRICALLLVVAFIGNLALLNLTSSLVIQAWLIVLYPLILLPLCVKLFQEDPVYIKYFVWIFLLALPVAIYKTFDASAILASEHGVLRQTNWGNALAAISPFIFLIKRKLLRQIFTLVVILVLIVSLKRSAMLAAIFLIFAYLAPTLSYSWIFQRKALTKIISLISGLILFSVGLTYVSLSSFFGEYVGRAELRVDLLLTDRGSGRLDFWRDGIEVFMDGTLFQMLFGRGFGWLKFNYNSGFHVESFHNDAIELLISYGVAGFILYIFLISRIASLAFFHLKNEINISFSVSTFLIFFTYSMVAGVFYYIYFFTPLIVAVAHLEATRNVLRTKIYSRR